MAEALEEVLLEAGIEDVPRVTSARLPGVVVLCEGADGRRVGVELERSSSRRTWFSWLEDRARVIRDAGEGLLPVAVES